MRLVITGADGFVGRALTAELMGFGHHVVASTMSDHPITPIPDGVTRHVSGPITGDTDWGNILCKNDVVVHLAARVHVMCETAADPLAEFRVVNTAGTVNLASQAAAAGCKRFIFMSTVGVNGNNSGVGRYKEVDAPRPHNNYSVSKWEAEEELSRISRESSLPVVIVRAPLVYGPGNPGNFGSLLRLVAAGIPLPFASVENLKSFVYVQNLVSALALCCSHPLADGLYMVCDEELVSTPELLRKLATYMGRSARLFPSPDMLLFLAGRIVQKSSIIESLLLSLAVDSSKIRAELGWKQPVTMEDGLKQTVDWFVSHGKKS